MAVESAGPPKQTCTEGSRNGAAFCSCACSSVSVPVEGRGQGIVPFVQPPGCMEDLTPPPHQITIGSRLGFVQRQQRALVLMRPGLQARQMDASFPHGDALEVWLRIAFGVPDLCPRDFDVPAHCANQNHSLAVLRPLVASQGNLPSRFSSFFPALADEFVQRNFNCTLQVIHSPLQFYYCMLNGFVLLDQAPFSFDVVDLSIPFRNLKRNMSIHYLNRHKHGHQRRPQR